MADQEDLKKEQETEQKTEQETKQETQQKKGLTARVRPWLITALAIIVCAGAGFVVGRVFGARGRTQALSAAEQGSPLEPMPQEQSAAKADTGQGWYYDLDPVVANLNEPGVTRYVRVALTFDVDNSLNQRDTVTLFDRKKPLMKHWLTLYLSNETIEDIRGEQNLRRMQSQISELFNEGLFPNAKPHIRRVLFKEFSIQ